MKKLSILFVTILFIITGLFAQTPKMFKYQAVLRDASGNVIVSQAKSVVIDILQDSPTGISVFTETHNVTTTAQGIINLNIGSVNTTGIATINWATNTYFIKIAVDGIEMGTSQLLSVPYALNSKNAENLSGAITKSQISDLPAYLTSYTETDPIFGAWNKSTGISITKSQISDLPVYLTSYTETDPNSWSKTGNAGTTAGTNFIGTTDNNNLVFKVNNVVSGTISTTGNTFFGYYTMYNNISGTNNAAFGFQSMSNNTNGSDNTAIGTYSLMSNTLGGNNTSAGFQSLNGNTEGVNNSALGSQSLSSNTIGSFNTAIGSHANVSSGALSNAIAIGYNAIVNASNKVQIGNTNVNYVALGTGTNVTLETGLVKITGGTPGAGKVLTSDATGLASWQTASVGGRTRSVVLTPDQFDLTFATGAITKTLLGGWLKPCVSIPDGSTTQLYTNVPIPSDWNGVSQITVTILYSSPATTGNMYFMIGNSMVSLGEDVVDPAGSSMVTLTPHATTANGLMEYSITLTPSATDKMIQVGLQRRGADPLDTSVDPMYVFGISISYTD